MNIYLDNSNVLELRSLTNSVTNAADTGATVAVTLLDASGAEVAGQTWPVSMSHVSGGTYRVTLSSTIQLISGHVYTARVDAVGSGGEVGEWNCMLLAVDRACE